MKSLKAFACTLALIVPSIAHAQAVPSTLLPGTMLIAGFEQVIGKRNYSCGIETANISEFQRTANGQAIITMMGLVEQQSRPYDPEPRNDSYPNGAVVLTFKIPTAGSMHFATPPLQQNRDASMILDPAHQDVPFSKYVQSYNTTTKALDVTFQIDFPFCKLPIHAIYYGY
jgi:hypothetical protein